MINQAVVPKRLRRRWLQYSLRSLLALAVVVGIGMTWLVAEKRKADRREAVVEAILKGGGAVLYDYQDDRVGGSYGAEPPGPRLLTSLLGNHFFANVKWASILGKVDGLRELTQLQELDIEGFLGADFSDDDMECLDGLPNLQSLRVAHLEISDAGLSHLDSAKSLRKLILEGNAQITDAGLKHVAHLSKLEELDLDQTPVTSVKYLAGLDHLEKLLLAGTKIDDAGLECISELRGLTALDVRTTEITDAGLAHIGKLHGLHALALNGSRITDAGLANLKSLTRLDELRLGDPEAYVWDTDPEMANISDAGLQSLDGMKELRFLTIESKRVTDEGVKRLRALSKLAAVTVMSNRLTKHGMESLYRALPDCIISWRTSFSVIDDSQTNKPNLFWTRPGYFEPSPDR